MMHRSHHWLHLRAAAVLAVAVVVLVAAPGCSDDDDNPVVPTDQCGAVALPVSGNANAPVVTDVALEVQSSVIVLHCTVTDPQGTADLQGIDQTIGVFQDQTCASTTIDLVDDIFASGTEETFGTVVELATNSDLYNAIAAATTWPVQLHIVDAGGNATNARVRARVFD